MNQPSAHDTTREADAGPAPVGCARALPAVAACAFGLVSLLLGGLSLAVFSLHVLIHRMEDGQCCPTFLSCYPCDIPRPLDLKFLLLGLLLIAIGAASLGALWLSLRRAE